MKGEQEVEVFVILKFARKFRNATLIKMRLAWYTLMLKIFLCLHFAIFRINKGHYYNLNQQSKYIQKDLGVHFKAVFQALDSSIKLLTVLSLSRIWWISMMFYLNTTATRFYNSICCVSQRQPQKKFLFT